MYRYAGLIVKKARKEKNLSQRGFIKSLGNEAISLRTLRRIENGDTVKIQTIKPLLDFFEIQLRYTLSDENEDDIMRRGLALADNNSIKECIKLIDKEINEYRIFFCGDVYTNDRYHISSLADLLIYLPLIDTQLLFEALDRIGGDFFNRLDYALYQLDKLYLAIPDTEEKKISDELVKHKNRAILELEVDRIKKYNVMVRGRMKKEQYINDLCDLIKDRSTYE